MACSCHAGAGSTVLQGFGRITVGGSGTLSDPYVVTEDDGASSLQLEVRDSATVNLTLFGSGTTSDPYIIKADTSSASSLLGLADVSPSPGVQQGAAPIWIGSAAGGHFELRTPGVRYTTHATRGNGLYQGELIREQDTGTRFEWDGSQWLDLTPAVIPPTALDASIVQNAGTLDPNTDWNTLTARGGVYRISNFASNVNGPAGAYNFGTLLVLISGLSVTQVYFTHSSARLYQRTKWNASDWTSWSSDATSADLTQLRSDLTSSISQLRTDATNGDNGLSQSIASETSARESQDTNLSNAISQLRTDAINGDSSIRNDFTSADNDIRNRLNTLEDSSGFGFTPASGWSVNRANVWHAGRVVQIDLSLTRNGSTINSGDIANMQVGSVTSGFGSGGFAPLTGGPGGSPLSAYISGVGVYLAALTANIVNGGELTLVGTWIRS